MAKKQLLVRLNVDELMRNNSPELNLLMFCLKNDFLKKVPGGALITFQQVYLEKSRDSRKNKKAIEYLKVKQLPVVNETEIMLEK